MITINDVMGMFKDFSVLAGKSTLDRELTNVTVIDAPDIGIWIKGGEFVLSTAYAFQNNIGLLFDVVKQMCTSGACAFGIKLDRYIKELPEEILKYADENNFPIVYIPNSYLFIDIITPLQQVLSNKELTALQYSEYVHNLFIEMMMKGVTVKRILDELERLINVQMALYQCYNDRIVFSSKAKELEKQVVKLKKGEMSNVSITRMFPFFELRLGNTVFGRLIFSEEKQVFDGKNKGNRKIAIEHAGMILILLIQREIEDNKIRAQYRDEFVQDLLYQNIKSEEEIQNRAKLYNWDFSNGGIVVIVDVDDYKRLYHSKNYNADMSWMQERQREIIFEKAKRVITQKFNKVVYSYLSDQIIFIVSIKNYDKEKALCQIIDTGDTIRKVVSESTNFTVTIGIGSYQSRIADVHKSYTQAKKSVLIGRAVYKKDRTESFDQLGVYKLLWAVMKSEEAVELYETYIGKLVEYDKEYHTELVQTTEAISKYDWNLMKAAKESFVHYNTIKYRFSKICEILEVNLRLKEEQINMELSLKLHYLNEGKEKV